MGCYPTNGGPSPFIKATYCWDDPPSIPLELALRGWRMRRSAKLGDIFSGSMLIFGLWDIGMFCNTRMDLPDMGIIPSRVICLG